MARIGQVASVFASLGAFAMFAKNRPARLAAVLTLIAGTSAVAEGDDVIVQPNGAVVKPMPKWKQRKLERKIQKLTGGEVVVEGTPVVPVRPRSVFRPIFPRREVRAISPGTRSVVTTPAPIVTETPVVIDSATTTSRPIYTNPRPAITSTPIVAETPVTIGTPIISTPSSVVSGPTIGPDSAVNPARNVNPVPPPAEVIPPPVETVPPPAGPAEPALEPVKAPRDSA